MLREVCVRYVQNCMTEVRACTFQVGDMVLSPTAVLSPLLTTAIKGLLSNCR